MPVSSSARAVGLSSPERLLALGGDVPSGAFPFYPLDPTVELRTDRPVRLPRSCRVAQGTEQLHRDLRWGRPGRGSRRGDGCLARGSRTARRPGLSSIKQWDRADDPGLLPARQPRGSGAVPYRQVGHRLSLFRASLLGRLLRDSVGSRPIRQCRHQPRSRPIQAPRPARRNRPRQQISQRRPASAPPPASPGAPRSRTAPDERLRPAV